MRDVSWHGRAGNSDSTQLHERATNPFCVDVISNSKIGGNCDPIIHMHACCAVPRARHLEFFHDHARIERMFFDGFCEPRQGQMFPDWSRPGLGLELKEKDAGKFLI